MKDSCRLFDKEFQELLNRNNSRGLSLWVSVRCNLSQYHLTGLYTEADILNVVYERAVRYVESGKKIDNLLAWSRKTAFNCTRELSRKHPRSQSFLEIHSFVDELEWKKVTDEEIDTDIALICEAFKQLPPLDQEVLQLNVIEGLSWKNVRERMALTGNKDRSEAALRKIKERAVKRLRKHFHALQEPPDKNTDTAA